MSKTAKTLFFCKQCGHESFRWEGKCPGCGEWDALVEAPAEQSTRPGKGGKAARAERAPRVMSLTGSSQLKPLKEHARERLPRTPIPIGEFHRVLGGGLVPGGSVLVGGEPGIGKSTLMLQMLGALAAQGDEKKSEKPRPWIYITGEEAPSQIAARAERMHAASGGKNTAFDSEFLKLASETDLETILNALEAEQPAVAVIDSVQTLRDDTNNSTPGSVSQVRDCAMALVDAGRRLNCAIFLIGHVTKEGTIAGPRVLEHIVDTVLNFEGETRLDLRVLRASKNRFGNTDEVGFFEMTQNGLVEVPDPSVVLLDRDSHHDKGPGTAIGALCEGTRVLLVELQGLTVPVPGGGNPRRRASGLDANRLAQLLAVLETKASVPYGMLDVFASAAGGFRVEEPAADLPLALALASVATGRSVREGLIAAGEVGLLGELRPVPRMEARISEAKRLGFKQILLPARGRAVGNVNGIKVLRAKTVREALAMGLE